MTELKGRILVLDDTKSILAMLEKQLGEAGYQVTTTTDVNVAAKHVGAVDVVIVDFHIGDITGYDAIKVLRKAAESTPSHCRFYLYTTDRAVVDECTQHGFDGCFAVKGNVTALIRQLDPAVRAAQMRAKFKQNGLIKQ